MHQMILRQARGGSKSSLRRRTTIAQNDPEMLIDKLANYVIQVRRLQVRRKFSPQDIIAMDETPLWSDMVATTTLTTSGSKDVPLKSTGSCNHLSFCMERN